MMALYIGFKSILPFAFNSFFPFKVMKDGQVTQSEKYEELLMAGTAFEELVNAHKDAITGLEPSLSENKNELLKPVTLRGLIIKNTSRQQQVIG